MLVKTQKSQKNDQKDSHIQYGGGSRAKKEN